jgi:hypothetical protein
MLLFMYFGLTRPGIEPTSYRTLSVHTNNYTTESFLDMIVFLLTVILWSFHQGHCSS